MNEKLMQHGADWTGQDLAGWLCSEKFNGVRMFWDGKTAWTRGGKVIPIPEAWRSSLPDFPLDGELYGPTLADANRAARGVRWCPEMSFRVFDAPTQAGCWLDRLAVARAAVSGAVQIVETWVAESNAAVMTTLARIQARGGEGIMARHPSLGTGVGRVEGLVKVKGEPWQ